jgi:geranylgeranyl diphosphate synthase type I
MSSEFRRAAEEVRRIFEERGSKVLEEARESVRREKIECREAREALLYFITHRPDVLRPALLSLACEAVGGDPSVTAQVGRALILLSGAFDIHDDIIDRTLVKKRRDTVLGRFGGDIALWTGDALAFKGHAELFEGLMRLDIPSERKVTIVRLIKDLYFEMGDGEVLELKLRARPDVEPKEYLYVVRKKAADVEACMRVGAIVGGGTEEQVNSLGEYGRLLGTIVFLRDDFEDILDVDTGLNMRLKNESFPLPLLYALEDKEKKKEILAILKGEVKDEKAERLLKLIFEARGIERLWRLFEELKAQGKRKTVGLKYHEIFNAILDATVPPPPE